MRIKQEKLWSAYNMEKTENAVRSRLLEAGKEEFRDRGFLKASLRAICKKADVTTGALYFFFESKAALFEEIVKETVEKLKELTGDFSNREKQLQPEEYDRILMEFIWENRDIAKILIDGAEGTRYVNFREDACTKMEQILNERFQKEWNSSSGKIFRKNVEKKWIVIWYIFWQRRNYRDTVNCSEEIIQKKSLWKFSGC